jgi:hypothetical protein
MTITTLDGALAGMQPPQPIVKAASPTLQAVAAQRFYTPFYVAGNPGAGSAPSSGTSGAAITGPIAGCINRGNPGSGNAYLARFGITASVVGTMWLIDRLWANSGLSVTTTTAQTVNSVTLPARDATGTTDGVGVMCAMEWSAAGGNGTTAATLTYTNSSNTGSRTGSYTPANTPPIGTFEVFSLAAGDYGIRSIQSITLNATRTSGTMHLVMFRVLAQVECSAANVGNAVDALTSGFPRIYNDSALQLVWIPSATTAVTFTGSYVETHG